MRNEGFIEIKLNETQTVTNMSHMFCRVKEEDLHVSTTCWQYQNNSYS